MARIAPARLRENIARYNKHRPRRLRPQRLNGRIGPLALGRNLSPLGDGEGSRRAGENSDRRHRRRVHRRNDRAHESRRISRLRHRSRPHAALLQAPDEPSTRSRNIICASPMPRAFPVLVYSVPIFTNLKVEAPVDRARGAASQHHRHERQLRRRSRRRQNHRRGAQEFPDAGRFRFDALRIARDRRCRCHPGARLRVPRTLRRDLRIITRRRFLARAHARAKA